MNCARAFSALDAGPAARAITAGEREGLVRSLRRFTRDADAAEDYVQSAYVRLVEYAGREVVNSQVRFLARAARNIAIDEARRQRVRTACAAEVRGLIEDFHGAQPLQDEVLLVRERLARARAVLDGLPERTRTIFLMHRFTRSRYREIATHFAISVSAVEKHIAKASRALATLGEQDADLSGPESRRTRQGQDQ